MEPIKAEKENLPTDSPVMLDTTMPATPTSAGIPYNPMHTNPNLSTSRRPPRKSTLTQQQKNQKRQRATQDQLITLEVEFNKNPTPTALVREQIAQEINMTERSVQIWFQNRRAKIKNIARKSIESGEDCAGIPESMRRHLALQAMDSGKPFLPHAMAAAGMGPFGNATLTLNTDTTSGKVVIHHFNCRSLSVGTWRRVGQTQMDLIIFYSPEKACVTYYINNDSAGYKIEYPFAWIKNMQLVQSETMNGDDASQQQPGELIVELNRPPKFYMDGSGGGGFYECSDFTEDQQASQILVHHLGGPAKVLASQLAKLISLDSYQNRHLLNPALTISAPVSPIGHRPASQPNHLIHPHTQMRLYHEQPSMGLMGPPPPRGHKRQRSRSVPIAIDFSMLRQPAAPFMVQQPQSAQQTATPVSAKSMGLPQEGIFAPVPQHHISNPFSSVNPGLSIDTSAGYGMEMRSMAGPFSATTIATASEFGTPAFFGAHSGVDLAPQATFGTPYNGSFLTVDAAAMIGTSNTPLSHHSADPIIADQSPPFDGSSAHDIFSTPNDQLLSEDAISLDMDKSMHRSFKSPLSQYSAAHYPSAALGEDSFDFHSPPPSSHKMELPFRLQDQAVAYRTPTHQSQQQLQDSGIAFNAPNTDQHMFHTPKEGNASMYQSPGQVQNNSNYHTPATADQNFQTPMHQTQQHFSMQTGGQEGHDFHSPLGNGDGNQGELNLSNFLQYGTIDPTSL